MGLWSVVRRSRMGSRASRIGTKRARRPGLPAMLLTIPYLCAANLCVQLIAGGGLGWLHLLVLLFIYSAMKFAIMGPVSLVLLLRARLREDAARRRKQRADRRPMVAVYGEVRDGRVRKKAARCRYDERQFTVGAVHRDAPDLHKLCKALIRLILQEVGQSRAQRRAEDRPETYRSPVQPDSARENG